MEKEEFLALEGRFTQGVAKLDLLTTRLAETCGRMGVQVEIEPVRRREGELSFWFAGTRYYARVRITDRGLDDAGAPVTVPIGWIDWGQCGADGSPGPVDESSYFDDRGVLFVVDREEIYCDLGRRDDARLSRALLARLSRLVTRSMAANGARGA